MRIIALMNQKGGVGKTTTTVNLGAALAEMGKRVLLIDLDPQAHLSINYGIEPDPNACSLYHLLVDGKPLAEAINPVTDRIWLIPSSIDLAAAEIELVQVQGRETLLKQRLEAYLIAHPEQTFDYVLLDCPPSLGLLTINALSVASEVLIPMQPHFLALQGVAKLLETVQLVSRRMNPRLKVSGIVLTMFDSQTKLSVEVVNELNGFILAALGKPLPWANARVFETKIRRNIKLAEAPSFGKPILDYDGASNGAADYRALAREVAGEPPLPSPVPKHAAARVTAATPKVQKPVSTAAASALPTINEVTAPSVPMLMPAPVPAMASPAPAAIAEAAVVVPAPMKIQAPLRPVPPAPRANPAAPGRPAHRTGTAAASQLIAATAQESRRSLSTGPAPARGGSTAATRGLLDEPPERTGPLRPIAPASVGEGAVKPANLSRSGPSVKVSINAEIDPAKLAASGARERNHGLESPDDSEAMA